MTERGGTATPKQRAALERGQQKRREALASHKPGDERQKDRWSRLLSGSLTVAELEDKEIERMRVYGKGKTFSGRAPMMPSHLAQQFHQEAIRRATAKIRVNVGKAVEELVRIATDPDAKDSDRLKAITLIMDRGMGKVPETVRIEGQTEFDRMLSEAVGLDRGVVDDAASDR